MATIHNEITVNASVGKVWTLLTDLELLDKYDPTVKKSTLLSTEITGIGAKRKVLMLDGKNWFNEKVTVFNPTEALTYQLTECSFPIEGLTHRLQFRKNRQPNESEASNGIHGEVWTARKVAGCNDDSQAV